MEVAELEELPRLRAVLATFEAVAVAVSGGVDSLTLAAVAGSVLQERATMWHATSPAVPQAATRRTVRLASEHGWTLNLFDAGEFKDSRYLRNPVNRCFFCKTNLYGAIAARTDAQILSGTNLDDLGDYRPGLSAAKDHGVRHPFVEAGIDKTSVREIAAHLGLGEVSELPSAPCLSSRMETGLAIEATALAFIDDAETVVRHRLGARTVRCRVRASGVVIELDDAALDSLHTGTEQTLRVELAVLIAQQGLPAPLSFEAYRTGSAFLRETA